MRKLRAIVMDDEQLILAVFKLFLGRRGYEVIALDAPVTCSVSPGTGVCRTRRPCCDVLLTDYRMPAVNGLELLDEQERRGCKLDVRNKALISGFLDAHAHKSVKRLGCRAFDKPIVFSEIEEWLAECEQRADLSRSLELPRKEERLVCDPGMACAVKVDHDIYPGEAVNRSESGLCLKVPQPLHVDQVVTLVTALPLDSFPAVVRWIRESGDGSSFAGISFC